MQEATENGSATEVTEITEGLRRNGPQPHPQPSIAVASVSSVAERSLSPRWLSLPDPRNPPKDLSDSVRSPWDPAHSGIAILLTVETRGDTISRPCSAPGRAAIDSGAEKTDPAGGSAEAPAPVTPWGIVSQFFVIPLVIVLVCAGLFAGLRWMTADQSSPTELLREIRSGNETHRGQAAYQLSMLLRSGDAKSVEALRKDPGFVPELLRIHREAKGRNPELRRYLTAVLLVLQDPRGLNDLLEAVEDPDRDTRCYAITALGGLGDPAATGALLERLRADGDSGVRLFAAFVLGKFESAAIVPALTKALDDPADEVRWNAALALAAKGDRAGLGVLERMLDREHLRSVKVSGTVETSGLLGSTPEPIGGMSDAQADEAILSALRAIDKLGAPEAAAVVAKLEAADPSPKVRDLAGKVKHRLERR